MSKKASKPDGTDPRILQPEGHEVLIPTATSANASRRYHEKGCPVIEDHMEHSPKPKDIAVAKWKGMEPCEECHGPRSDGRGESDAVEGPTVDRYRRALAWTDCSAASLAEAHGRGHSTIRKHATGTAVDHYDTPPETPTVSFDHDTRTWSWDA